MDLTHPRVGATQFTTFMAATNGCESWSAWAGGALVASSGYGWTFITMASVSLVGLLILRMVHGPTESTVQGSIGPVS
jgi:hypothetical protein